MSLDFSPSVVHHFAEGLYAKQMVIPAEHFIVQHKHAYDHISILANGRAAVDVDDEITHYEAPACINIEAGKHHTIIALTDVVWFCVHATQETDPEKIDNVLIGG